MGRKPREDIPDHPTIIKEVVVSTIYGRDRFAVQIVCPGCQTTRVQPLSNVRAAFDRGNFTGRCQGCRKPRSRGPSRVGRRTLPDGFIAIFEPAITSDEELGRFRRRANQLGWLLEQRWIMSELIGRDLKDFELVLHKNGKRDDNRITNLELVIKWPSGKTMSVLGELERARMVIKRYASIEAALRAAETLVAEVQESAPQDDDCMASTTASTSENVSPAE